MLQKMPLKSKVGKIQSKDVSVTTSRNHDPKSPLASAIIKRTFANIQPTEKGQGISSTYMKTADSILLSQIYLRFKPCPPVGSGNNPTARVTATQLKPPIYGNTFVIR